MNKKGKETETESAPADEQGQASEEQILDDSQDIAEGEDATDSQDGEDLNQQCVELKDQLLRALAENENQRKRGERDRHDAEVYGGRKLARDLLSVYDNMKRAMESISDEQRANNKGLIDGIELTRRELLNVFANHKIVPVSPKIGDAFDPENHEAMYKAPVPKVPKDCVAQVLSEGFMIADRLLRPAQVGVSSGEPETPSEEPA